MENHPASPPRPASPGTLPGEGDSGLASPPKKMKKEEDSGFCGNSEGDNEVAMEVKLSPYSKDVVKIKIGETVSFLNVLKKFK